MPQASSAHDTFWDFVSLMPESMHHVLWVMSDRGIPRSYRTMQGFGVNTYRLVNAEGVSHFVKFHWLPEAGTHSLVWDEAVKIAGADPDFHRRDLWEAIEAGQGPMYELALQVVSEAQAAAFGFDILDPTKIVPEELVPLRPVGRLVLDRNPDNFFAETEQVAFCVAHVVPGIDFSNDPLLQGRIHSYLDTQLSRLGGPNFHEIPINAPLAEVHNHQRDGLHRQAIHRGRVNYEPNSLGGGCPFQAGAQGFVSVAERMADDKVRAKPEKFADHYSQARLFWRSQTAVEKQHIAAAFRFELSRVTVPAIRLRVISQLIHVDERLAQAVADDLGLPLPLPQPLAQDAPADGEVEASPGLSLFARPGETGAAGRRIALLVLDGADGASLREVQRRLLEAKAMPRHVGLRLGRVAVQGGDPLEIEASIEAMPSVLWDALVLPAGDGVLAALAARPEAVEFLADAYRHGKPILALGADAAQVRAAAGVPARLEPNGSMEDHPQPDPGLVCRDGALDEAIDAFLVAVARHRHYEREPLAAWS
jgi:catalase